MNLVKEVPCLHCGERHKLCHSHCEKYKAYRQRHDAIKSERAKRLKRTTLWHRYCVANRTASLKTGCIRRIRNEEIK